ncbi:MAG: DUF4335 domain-containing protein [Pseudanabaenaceae cyanobacterium bins.68]|nr:DUF4335 domain-containing protein [Pseudanabaenaceae cyanobacterium bins.68]
MPIQRTYSLPSCTLVVEGIGSEDALSILTNFELQFHDAQAQISGGRHLLVVIFTAVQEYVKELLLQLHDCFPSKAQPSLAANQEPSSRVFLETVAPHQHLLHIQAIAADSSITDPLVVKLGTVQLFDLVEIFDQLGLDPQTLPDLVLPLQIGVLKRQPTSPLPILLGVSGLAIAAGAMLVIMPPLLKRPEPVPVPVAQPVPKVLPPKPPQLVDPKLLQVAGEKLRQRVDQAWQVSISFSEDLSFVVTTDQNGEVLDYQPTAATKKLMSADLDQELPLQALQTAYKSANPGKNLGSVSPTYKFNLTFSPRDGGVLELKPVNLAP